MARSPRSRDLLSWVPALILVVVIAGVVFTTIAVQNSWWTEEDPVASTDQKATDGSSKLSDAGLDYVNVEGALRVRVGEGALPATEIGLGADEEKSASFRRPVRTIVAAGDETYVVDASNANDGVDVICNCFNTRHHRVVFTELLNDGPGK